MEAREWAEPRRWGLLSDATKQTTIDDNVADRHPAMTGMVSEMVLVLIEQAREDGELDAVEVLAGRISKEIGEEFERHLGDGGPDHRSNRHLWCVILAAICRLYDQGFSFIGSAVDDLVHEIMQALREDISADRSDDTRARDVYWHKYQIAAAFDLAAYSFLEGLVKRAVGSVVTAAKTIGEEVVVKYLRLIGAITCPDPDRHPDIVKFCLWPLLVGPFSDLLEESVATEMRGWLRNSYVTVPSG